MSATTPSLDSTSLASFVEDTDHLETSSRHTFHAQDPERTDSSTFQQGILDTLAPVMQELDMRVAATRSSQAELLKELQRVQAELQMLLTATQAPESMSSDVEAGLKKLDAVRKRLVGLNANLNSCELNAALSWWWFGIWTDLIFIFFGIEKDKVRLDKVLAIIAAPRR